MSEQPPSPTPSRSQPVLLGRYRVVAQVGEWRLAQVYSALDDRLQRQVLVHLLRKDLVGNDPFVRRFQAEAAAAARRSHQALLEVFDSGELAGRPFMITEYIEGRPLYGIGALGLDQALLYMRQVIGAVALCQARRTPELPLGLPHPPISSNNLWLVDEGRIKLVESWRLPTSAVALDLAHYRPPERASGHAPTPASAVYSLGLLLYELATGRRPISGDQPAEVAAAHLQARIRPLSQVRPALYLPSLDRLLERAMSPFPDQRYPDAQAFGDALEHLWRELGSTTRRFEVPINRPAPRPLMPQRPAAGQARPLEARPVEAPPPPVRPAIIGGDVAAPQPQPRGQTLFGRIGTGWLRPLDKATISRQNRTQNAIGSIVLISMLIGAALLGFVGVNYAIENADEFSLPTIGSISLPNFDDIIVIATPTAAAIRGESYVVNISEGLNLRNQPGVDGSQIINLLPNGTRVERLEGPVIINASPWIRVRASGPTEPNEGWVNQSFLIAEE